MGQIEIEISIVLAAEKRQANSQCQIARAERDRAAAKKDDGQHKQAGKPA